ncbi:MAG: nitroreductase [Thermodesulfobacteriota bacterium]|nr:nitroreductase [Thermodesulfobacteriota bacterium]
MDIIDAIEKRMSIRGFKKDPVPKEVLKRILEVSVRAPSANNTQPWEFVVLTGKVLDDLKKANVDQFNKGAEIKTGIPTPPTRWVDPYRKRQVELGVELFRLLGIGREDKEARAEWAKRGMRFFDAPAAILICVDESDLDIVYLFDIGVVAQTITLVAVDHGLGTCIQRQVTHYPDEMRRVTGIPESKRILIGIAIGYPDWDYPGNTLKSTREPVDHITTWLGSE